MSVTDNYTQILDILRTDTFDDWKYKTNFNQEIKKTIEYHK